MIPEPIKLIAKELLRSRFYRTALMLAATVTIVVYASAFLANLKLEHNLVQLNRSQANKILTDLRYQIEYSLTLGLDLSELVGVTALLTAASADASIDIIEVLDRREQPLFSSVPKQHSSLQEQPRENREIVSETMVISNSFGENSGALRIRVRLDRVNQAVKEMQHTSVGALFLLSLTAASAVFFLSHITFSSLIFGRQTTNDLSKTLAFRLTGLTVVILLVATGFCGWMAMRSFEPIMQPELIRKAQLAGVNLQGSINRALRFGIPLSRVEGLEEAFTRTLADNRELSRISLVDNDGRTILTQTEGGGRDTHLSVEHNYPISTPAVVVKVFDKRNDSVGNIIIDLDKDYISKKLFDLMIDVFSMVLVSILVVFEFMTAFAQRNAASIFLNNQHAYSVDATRGAGDESRWLASVSMRLPVFLLAISEELSRSFLPEFSRSLARDTSWITPSLAVSLPVTAFMLIWALSQPLGMFLSSRAGNRRCLSAGACLVSIGLVGTVYVTSLTDFLLLRCITALGYGLLLITAQCFVISNTNMRNRASGLANYVGALLAAGVCGPLAGGILADQFGIRETFLFGALMALSSLAAISIFARQNGTTQERAHIPVTKILSVNGQIIKIIIMSALPTKMAATAFLFCLAPMILSVSGASNADIGRVLMLYYIAFILVSPLCAKLADRLGGRAIFIALGGVLTLAAATPALIIGPPWGIAISIALFGAAQALIGVPQLTLVSEIAARANISEAGAIAMIRLVERLGGALGPVCVTFIMLTLSEEHTMLAIGAICAVSGAALLGNIGRGRPTHASPV